MTLIITIATPLLIVQAGDRLLTTQLNGKIQQFDEKSNKSLVYEASNGLLAISYCGKAFTMGIPTDEWIAEQLNPNFVIPRDGSDPWSLQTGGHSNNDILSCDGVIKILRERMTGLAKSEFVFHDLTIVITGWKKRKNRIEHIIVEITRKQRSETAERPIGWKRQQRLKYNFFVSIVGSGHRTETDAYLDAELGALRQRIPLPQPGEEYLAFADEFRKILVSTIRFASTIEKTVGANVHSATLYRPGYQYNFFAQTHFYSDMPHPATIVNSRWMIDVADAAITGWVLLKNTTAAPSYLIGDIDLQGKLVKLQMKGAPPQDHVSHIFTPLQRQRKW